MKKTLLFTGLLASTVVVLSGCGRTKINANDYLKLNVSGYDTVGKAYYDVDVEKLVDDNLSAFGLEDDMSFSYLGVVANVEDCLSGKIDKSEELKNGDKIKYTWNESGFKKLEDKYKVKIKFDDEKLEIDTLEDLKEFNPFEYINITYTGIAPNGDAQISSKDGIPFYVSFNSDKKSNLVNGDVIKVTASGNSSSDFAEYCLNNGYIPSCIEKEFTVEGLASYVQVLDELPEESVTKMDAHAQDKLKATVADSWKNPETFKKMELIGNYLLTPKDPSIYVSDNNYLYFIYKVTVTPESGEFNYYYYTRYSNIMLLEDGTCSFDLGSATAPESSFWGGGESFERDNLSYGGYEDIDSMFNKLVTSKIDQYKYESTVK